VQGKIAKVTYFQEQGLEVFLDKLRAQGWLELFANTQLGCSVPDLAEFYANCNITNAVVTSEVNKKNRNSMPKIWMLFWVFLLKALMCMSDSTRPCLGQHGCYN